MRPLRHVSHSPCDIIARLLGAHALPLRSRSIQHNAIPLILRQSRSLNVSSQCIDYRKTPFRTASRSTIYVPQRAFSSSGRCLEERPPPSAPENPVEPPPQPKPSEAPTISTTSSDSRVPETDLPSHRATQRWQLSKRFASIVDKLQSDLIIASQRLNRHTGTDYSGIEALRQEIKHQEQLVKTCQSSLNLAKERYDTTLSQQAASQKEVVGLLERKHSWSASDLERYMSLIRSEHTNEQGVQAAKEERMAAERALEEARAKLEKIERTQYHEEQIWSDTIRRNSTWVTFGLMGFNIALLLASLVILEPWRRRRLVREIKGALDERAAIAPPSVAAAIAIPEVEKEIDAVTEPEVSVEELEQGQGAEAVTPKSAEATVTADLAPQSDQDIISEIAQTTPISTSRETTPSPPTEPSSPPHSSPSIIPPSAPPGSWTELFDQWKQYFRDLFSERQISLRKVDLTTTALEGAAAGAAFMGLLFVLLRPR